MIKIEDLINSPIIRNDQPHETLNKMTDEEILSLKIYFENELENENINKTFPDWNVGMLTKFIDLEILYQIIKDNNLK